MLHNPPRILLVEDDDAIRNELIDALSGSGFAVTPTATYEEAEDQLSQDHSLVLLDLWLHDRDGLQLCRQLRMDHNPLPVIILSARDQPDEIVRGLDAGADDYVTKPFRLPEIMARIRSVLRRMTPAAGPGNRKAGPLELNGPARRVCRNGVVLSLKPREFELLEFFMKHPGRAWTRGQLLTQVWGPKYVGDDRTVDLHVARLRSAIEENPRDPQWIETVWRVGYRFREEEP